MDNPIQKLTQSKYFTPAFNVAIYDGPLRIYFAQAYESEALKIYFHLQQKVAAGEIQHEASEGFVRNIFVMLYPTEEIFASSFDGHEAPVICETMGRDFVVGVKGPIDEADYELIPERLSSVMKSQGSLSFI